MPQLEMTLDEYHALSKPAGRKRGMQPEHIIQNQILAYLEVLPHVYAWRVNSGKIKNEAGRLITLAPAGTSDICGYVSLNIPIRFSRNDDIDAIIQHKRQIAIALAIEVKATAKNTPTPFQQAYLDGVTQAGGFALVARSVSDVQTALEAFVAEMEGR